MIILIVVMKMNINLIDLINDRVSEIEVDGQVSFEQADLDAVGIRKMDEVLVKGNITKTYGDEFLLNLSVIGNMILPCSLTLVDVPYPFNIKIDEILSENDEDIEIYSKIINNTIDIIPIIWQNIVVEIPFKVISPDATIEQASGDGWRLLTENDEKEIDPRLEKLKDLIKD